MISNQGSAGNEGAIHGRAPHRDVPYWKRAHHDWRFWIALVLMLVAITIYATSHDLPLLFHRGNPPQQLP